MNPITFLTSTPAAGAQRMPTAPAAVAGQFGGLLSALLGTGGNSCAAGTPTTAEGAAGKADPETGESGMGTALPVPGFVLPVEQRPMAPAVSFEPEAGSLTEPEALDAAGVEVAETPEAVAAEPTTLNPGRPEPGTAAPDTVRPDADPRLPSATPSPSPTAPSLPVVLSVPVVSQQGNQPEESAVQESAGNLEPPAVAATTPRRDPAGSAVAQQPRPDVALLAGVPVRPLTEAGVFTAEAGPDQLKVASPVVSAQLVAAAASTSGPTASGVLRPLLIPVDETADGTVPLGLPVGPVHPGSTAAPAPVQAPAPVRTLHAEPLHRQLAGPLLMLATGPHGERTLSLQIAPEALGPITVKAVIGSEGLRVELTAPGEAGREALRAMLPDLRRELASTGAGTVHLGTGPDPGGTGNGPASGGAGHFAPGRHGPGSTAGPRQGSLTHLQEPPAPVPSSIRSTGLDVLA